MNPRSLAISAMLFGLGLACAQGLPLRLYADVQALVNLQPSPPNCIAEMDGATPLGPCSINTDR
jgi:hypothetical protein